MTRTIIVTGSASGIGEATAAKLRADGHRVIGVDLKDADIAVDLTTAEGRTALVEQATELSGGVVEGVLAIAGLVAPAPVTVAVNHFGAIATLEGLRPLLAKSEAPRAAVVASLAALEEVDEELLRLIETGDEDAALAHAGSLGATANATGSSVLYTTSKLSVARWTRRTAPSADWAKAGIALNAVAPGVILTPMTAAALETEEGRAALDAGAPAPYGGPAADPAAIANLLAWLISPENLYVTGQVIFADGGAESIRRPELV
ncbi:SDR family oxidoreductase [Arenivirga flava]|uniref:Short-chain dehydrogenase n=1 Tax=Arenivirga flava TaxID=1930060 RepID=A0AA37XBA6_9MICO|nr:SDR family oxidoreductase [Arenivirga flava]GMA27377.1 short-chain dehydrogenase [Arenivirga flava]